MKYIPLRLSSWLAYVFATETTTAGFFLCVAQTSLSPTIPLIHLPIRNLCSQTANMSSARSAEKQLEDLVHAETSLKDAEALANTPDWTPKEEKAALRKLDWCLIPM